MTQSTTTPRYNVVPELLLVIGCCALLSGVYLRYGLDLTLIVGGIYATIVAILTALGRA
jgi:hypothetical protein